VIKLSKGLLIETIIDAKYISDVVLTLLALSDMDTNRLTLNLLKTKLETKRNLVKAKHFLNPNAKLATRVIIEVGRSATPNPTTLIRAILGDLKLEANLTPLTLRGIILVDVPKAILLLTR